MKKNVKVSSLIALSLCLTFSFVSCKRSKDDPNSSSNLAKAKDDTVISPLKQKIKKLNGELSASKKSNALAIKNLSAQNLAKNEINLLRCQENLLVNVLGKIVSNSSLDAEQKDVLAKSVVAAGYIEEDLLKVLVDVEAKTSKGSGKDIVVAKNVQDVKAMRTAIVKAYKPETTESDLAEVIATVAVAELSAEEAEQVNSKLSNCDKNFKVEKKEVGATSNFSDNSKKSDVTTEVESGSNNNSTGVNTEVGDDAEITEPTVVIEEVSGVEMTEEATDDVVKGNDLNKK